MTRERGKEVRVEERGGMKGEDWNWGLRRSFGSREIGVMDLYYSYKAGITGIF